MGFMTATYVTIVKDPTTRYRNAQRAMASIRQGSVIRQMRLGAQYGDWDTLREEAARMYPDRLVVIPALGEQIPVG